MTWCMLLGMDAPRFCIDDLGEDKVKARYDEMMAGDNRQPCKVCAKRVKAEFCFCHVCGDVLCDVHFGEHLTSEVPLGKLEKS